MSKKLTGTEYHQQWKLKNPTYMSEWRAANGERMKQTNKVYYEKNKERILFEYAKPVTCECGKTMRRNNYPRHLKSPTHARLMKDISNTNNKNKE